MIAAAYSIPGSIFRAFGGVLSDRKGARSRDVLGVLAYRRLQRSSCPCQQPVPMASSELRPPSSSSVIFVLGFFMSLGKAAVYKHIPAYYPDSVGAVGGVVGMVGGLGGFMLPIAFGALKDAHRHVVELLSPSLRYRRRVA